MSRPDTYKASVISIVPFKIDEEKPGIYPGHFEIPPAKEEEPQVLIVGESVYHVEVDENRTVTVKCPPHDIARAIVEDYVISNLGYSFEGNAAPGIFWVPGIYNVNDVKTKLKAELEAAKTRQWNWFRKLVQMADDDWEKTRQHKTISDTQRYAAKAMSLERPWLITPKEAVRTEKCPVCRTIIDPEAIVCMSCKLILKPEQYKQFKFAEVGVK